MELYAQVSAAAAELFTKRYSTSFASASRLFPATIRPDIYNIYGLVRIADEVVDSYDGGDQATILDELQQQTHQAISRGYSANPIVHAFALTARRYGIGADLIDPFFASMRLDLAPQTYTPELYAAYIYGSAEVVGLMCLRVFCAGDSRQYDQLQAGARRLGAAYQKVNFLRDIAADHTQLKRFYFPGYTFASFDAAAKQAVTADMRADFTAARPYVLRLPAAARPAVMTSYRYYEQLLTKLEKTDVAVIKNNRIRLPAYRKLLLLAGQVRKGAV